MNFFFCRNANACKKCTFPMSSNSIISLQICNECAQHVQYADASGVPISHLDYECDWMAAEQLSGKPADEAGYVFSFEILVWECVTRRHPLKYVKSLEQVTNRTITPRLQKIPLRELEPEVQDPYWRLLKSAENRPNFQQLWRVIITKSDYFFSSLDLKELHHGLRILKKIA